MRKICIIGKTGQLGGALLSQASAHDYAPLAPDHASLDITDPYSVRRALDNEPADIVINTAAFQRVPDCETDPKTALTLNTAAVHTLATICRERKIRFVNLSTDYVFAGTKGFAYDENDTPAPLQMYGISKFAGEQAALAAYPQGTYVIRTSALYGGEKGSPSKGNFVLNTRDKLSRAERVEVVSDQITSPTYSEHLADALFQVLSKGAPGIYHLAGEGAASWYDFAVEVQRVFELPGALVPTPTQEKSSGPRRPRMTSLENRKAHGLGIFLPPWQDGLRAYRKFLACL